MSADYLTNAVVGAPERVRVACSRGLDRVARHRGEVGGSITAYRDVWYPAQEAWAGIDPALERAERRRRWPSAGATSPHTTSAIPG